ncbi:MAG: N-acetylmuramidase family protein [Paramuribaculum sp.]|nr:N-acetylmuramidase family protein [Paramuribaculum sp.]
MKQPVKLIAGVYLGICGCTTQAQGPEDRSVEPLEPEPGDSTLVADEHTRLGASRLTEADYREVAAELGVEVAALKAIVEIEAGKDHLGIVEDSLPVINFDLTMFKRFAGKHGVNLGNQRAAHPEVFAKPNVTRYGNHQLAQHARFNGACDIDEKTAIYATFWGMFQIGGFNWKLCDTESPQQFVELMSRSERDQLELFARLITKCDYVKYLQAKNWAEFARHYNGPSYARRGYHTRMANAFAKYSRQAKSGTSDTAEQTPYTTPIDDQLPGLPIPEPLDQLALN